MIRSYLEIFNPFSTRYHSWQDFHQLNRLQKIGIGVLTFLATLGSFGTCSVAVFRTLVGRFKVSTDDKTKKTSQVVFPILSPGTTKTNHRCSIRIANLARSDYIGNDLSSKHSNLSYLNQITLEDGRQLPLDPQDIFIEFDLFDFSTKPKGIPEKLVLPSVLFVGKKEGEKIKLRWNNQLIELTIDQSSHPIQALKNSFEDLLNFTTKAVKGQIPVKESFSGTFSLFGYKLDESGILYQFQGNNGKLILEEKGSRELRPLRDPMSSTLVAQSQLSESKDPDLGQCIFRIYFPAFDFQDIDIILNPTHLIFYGVHTDPEDGYVSERIASFPLNNLPFKDFNLDKIKLEKSEITLDKGFLTIKIPKK